MVVSGQTLLEVFHGHNVLVSTGTYEQPYIRGLCSYVVSQLLQASINNMVNWHDPVVLLKDYSASRVFHVSQYRY